MIGPLGAGPAGDLAHQLVEDGVAEILEAQPWWFYGIRFWIDLAPWSFAAPFAVVWAWRRGLLHDDPVCRFGLAWFVAMFVLLSFSVFKRSGDMPLYQIEKNPKFAQKQGAFSIVNTQGRILKRGHDLAQVMKFFDKVQKLRD